MAAVQQSVLNWLYSVLTSEYHDVNRTYNDVAQALSFYSSLAPKTDVYTHEHGQSHLLLQLSGTLPVLFRGTTYRFPLTIWIPHAYPHESPFVYVSPTEGMAVRAGQHVDPQGKVYHPYLAGWSDYNQRCNILDFLEILRQVFAKEPPVIAKQMPRSSSTTSSIPPSIPPRVPPHPMNDQHVLIRPPTSPGAPLPPPKPGYDSRVQASSAGRYDSAPPLPPIHISPANRGVVVQSYQNDQSQYQPQRQSSLRYESAAPILTDIRRSSLHEPMQQHLHGVPHKQSQIQPTQQHPHQQQHTSHFTMHSAPLQSQQLQVRGQLQPQEFAQQRPKPQTPRDLMDEPLTLNIPMPAASQLPAPPIPPNPEKDMLLHTLAQALYAQRQQSLQQTQTTLPGLQAQHTAMMTALNSMNHELSSLQGLSTTLTTNTAILHSSLQAADAVISSSQTKEVPKIDELLVAPTTVGNQLYELVNEERALTDAMFVLGRAVERGRVEGKVFVRVMRGLARELFLKKALVRKIELGMGLDSVWQHS